MQLLRLIAVFLLSCAPVVNGTIWERYALKDLVADHPLIVVGEIVGVQQTVHRGKAFDIAYIRVEKVLKNSLPKDAPQFTTELPLWMPSTRDEAMSTDDVRHSLRTSGIWFLSLSSKGKNSRRPEGVFHTQHPDEVQPRRLITKVAKLAGKSQRPSPAAEQTGSGVTPAVPLRTRNGRATSADRSPDR